MKSFILLDVNTLQKIGRFKETTKNLKNFIL